MKFISIAVSDWHRLWSLRLAILSAAFGAITATYAMLPADWLPAIPNWMKLSAAIGTFIAPVSTAVARVIKQNNLTPPDAKQ
ncbi:MAG TPA: hypothetical protein VJQ26_02620 [Ktedonobacteraceae bacterium]|nr:hypothetical protein [Ktedonobacteraceae bacterium]